MLLSMPQALHICWKYKTEGPLVVYNTTLAVNNQQNVNTHFLPIKHQLSILKILYWSNVGRGIFLKQRE